MLFLQEGALLDEEAAELLRRRARRACSLQWEEPPDADVLRARLDELGCEDVRLQGTRVHLHLPAGDPRETLGRLLEAGDLPAPRALRYGESSLNELYRELYGTEGV